MDEDPVDLDLPQWLQEELATKGYLTPRQLANYLHISPQVIYNYLRTNRIKGTLNASGKIVITRNEINKYLTNRYRKELAKRKQIEAELNGN